MKLLVILAVCVCVAQSGAVVDFFESIGNAIVSTLTFGFCGFVMDFSSISFGCSIGVGCPFANAGCGYSCTIAEAKLSTVLGYNYNDGKKFVQSCSWSCFAGIQLSIGCSLGPFGCAYGYGAIGISCDDDDTTGENGLYQEFPDTDPTCLVPTFRYYMVQQTADYLEYLYRVNFKDESPEDEIYDNILTMLEGFNKVKQLPHTDAKVNEWMVSSAIEEAKTTGCPDLRRPEQVASLWSWYADTCYQVKGQVLEDLYHTFLRGYDGKELGAVKCDYQNIKCSDHEGKSLMDNIMLTQKCAFQLGPKQIEERFQKFFEFIGDEAADKFPEGTMSILGGKKPSEEFGIMSVFMPCVGVFPEETVERVAQWLECLHDEKGVAKFLDEVVFKENENLTLNTQDLKVRRKRKRRRRRR